MKKPPMGIVPKWILLEHGWTATINALRKRQKQLNKAIGRYKKEKVNIPETWKQEKLNNKIEILTVQK